MIQVCISTTIWTVQGTVWHMLHTTHYTWPPEDIPWSCASPSHKGWQMCEILFQACTAPSVNSLFKNWPDHHCRRQPFLHDYICIMHLSWLMAYAHTRSFSLSWPQWAANSPSPTPLPPQNKFLTLSVFGFWNTRKAVPFICSHTHYWIINCRGSLF